MALVEFTAFSVLTYNTHTARYHFWYRDAKVIKKWIKNKTY